MKEAYKGSDIVRWLVIVADFIIPNFVLFLAINWDKISVPIVFFHASKICYFVANVSLFLGELLFASIIHIRKIRFIQVLDFRHDTYLQSYHVLFAEGWLRLN